MWAPVSLCVSKFLLIGHQSCRIKAYPQDHFNLIPSLITPRYSHILRCWASELQLMNLGDTVEPIQRLLFFCSYLFEERRGLTDSSVTDLSFNRLKNPGF